MTGVTLRGLLHRKTRALLTALAIVLGVAMVSGTYILTDTIDRAFTTVFTSSYASSDVVVSSRTLVEGSSGGGPTVPATVLDEIRELPQVEAASGALLDLSGASRAQLIDSDGTPIDSDVSLAFGVDPSDTRFNPLTLTDGAWAGGPDEVVIDQATADDHGFAVGQEIDISADGPKRSFTISGTALYGDVESLGGATIAAFDVPTARGLLGKSGFDVIFVSARPDVSNAELTAAVQPLLPDTAQVQDAADRATDDQSEIAGQLDVIRYLLLGFAGIALFVGAFVIVNTLSITIAQRTRELATLRTLGASRRQVLRSVMLEALGIGAIASVAGLVLGLGLAKGLEALFRLMDFGMPEATTVIAARTVVVSLLVGILVTLFAALLPAIRATRIAPIAAIREGAPAASRQTRRSLAIAVGVIVVALAGLLYGSLAGGAGMEIRLIAICAGALLLFVGVALIAPRLVRPLAAAVGYPASRLAGAPGALARENAVRNPARTASTAAALMIGLALVTFVALLGRGLMNADRDATTAQISGDYALTAANGYEPITPAAGRRIAGSPVVAVASAARTDRAEVAGDAIDVNGIAPATIGQVYDFEWQDGSGPSALGSLGADGAIVEQGFADAQQLAVGDRFRMVTPSGDSLSLRVRGIHDPPGFDPLLGSVAISQATFDRAFARPKDTFTLIRTVDGVTPETTTALEEAVSAFPDATVWTTAEYADQRSSEAADILSLLYILLALSVLVGLFGMINTLVLAVFERTRELGMLRAIGMTRGQVRRMILHESVITALIGGVLGLAVGIVLAAVVTRSLSSSGVALTLPVVTLAIFALAAMAAGVLAALVPARHAARLRPLEAVQHL